MQKIDVLSAYERIKGKIHPSPLLYSHYLSTLTKASVFLKLENLNTTGSFKERGAVSFLTAPQNRNISHVVCASAGNHAQAVAYYSSSHGIACTIFMPVSTPNNKVERTINLGANVILVGKNYDQAFRAARKFAFENRYKYLHAYNDEEVIAGQGSIGVEIFQKLDPDILVVPVGGGGLISGIGCFLKQVGKTPRLIGVESHAVKSMAVALKNGQPIMLKSGQTIADGINVRKVGDINFRLCQSFPLEMHSSKDEAVLDAMAFLLEKHKMIVEGSGAISVSCLIDLAKNENLTGKKIVCLISGGNADLNLISRIISQQLVKTSRILRISLVVNDTPGELAKVLKIITEGMGNILDIVHDRYSLNIRLHEVLIYLTIGLKNHEHHQQLLGELKTHGYRIKIH